MKIAVLGTGFGAYHVELYKKIEAVDQIIVFGRTPEKLKALEEKFGVATTTRLEKIYDDPEVSLVDVCMPSGLHAEFVIDALEAGKHVFCETPLSLSNEDAQRMVAARAGAGRLAFVNLFLRFEFPYVYLHELQQQQTYGALKSFRIQRKTPPIWGDLGREKIATELMIHDIDFTSWLLGAPRSLTAWHADGKPGQCAVTGLLEYESSFAEVIGSSMMPVSYPFAVAYEAIFENASVRYSEDGYRDRVIHSLELFTADGMETIAIPQGNCFENVLRHAVDCVQGQAKPVNSLEDAAESLKLALEMRNQIT